MTTIIVKLFDLVTFCGVMALFWTPYWWLAALTVLAMALVGSERRKRPFIIYRNNELRMLIEAIAYVVAIIGFVQLPLGQWLRPVILVEVALGATVMLPIAITVIARRQRGGHL